MKIFQSFILLSFILFTACNTSTDSEDSLNFEDISIEYKKTGGWINNYILEIDSTGFINAYVSSQSTLELMDSKYTNLTEDEKEELEKLFYSFDNFKHHYQPDHFYTDQNFHTIILKNGTSIETTSVYDPSHCNIPKDLNRIILFMDQKIDELLN